ncbi:MAG: response regulator [Deltaproteobacteria bacterium]
MRPTQRHRVLIVDDDVRVLRHTARQLGEVFDVVCAADAHVALMHVCAAAFHAVLTDFEMPGPNGLWLLEQLSVSQPSVRRVLTSGRPAEVFEEAMRIGLVHTFVPKPASLDGVHAAIGLVGGGVLDDGGVGVDQVA